MKLPKRWRLAKPADPVPEARPTFDGWVGLFAGRRIAGWLACPDDLDRKHSVRVRVGKYLSDPVTANAFRPHLFERDMGDGAYGFNFDLPYDVPLDPATGRFEIVLAESHTPVLSRRLSEFAEVIAREPDRARAKPVRARRARDKQADSVLIWCPLSVSGLTTQLFQVTGILKAHDVPYQISYHAAPTIEHPEREHWIDPADIDQPKLVLFFERFEDFGRGFESAFKVFYVNLDWLRDSLVPLVRTHADLVLAPTPYRLDDLRGMFSNQTVLHLPWPPAFLPDAPPERPARAGDDPIRVLYVGNDYDEISRKSPFAVVDAVLACTRSDLRVDLKFRTRLPEDVRARLEAAPVVGEIIDRATPPSVIEALHRAADISLIPNECEGNGLSIIEAWALGVVPAVLDGHPMKDVTSEDTAFLIPCDEVGEREKTKLYKTDAARLLAFLDGLTRDGIDRRRAAVAAMVPELHDRAAALERVVMASVRASGIRGRAEIRTLKAAHEVDAGTGQPAIVDLMFADQSHRALTRPTAHIDVMMSTSRRPEHFARSLEALVRAMERSPFAHRLFVSVDGIDPDTRDILEAHRDRIDQVLETGERMGLPYMWNGLNAMVRSTIARSERRPDHVCYIQDDCLIADPDSYFATMAAAADETAPGTLGFVSGYHTEVHPGFAETTFRGQRLIFSDSVDGKNFMGRPRLLSSIGPLTWWFSDGMRRGNPGPVRGSHFDLWQWRESPNSLTKQRRVSLILPDLTRHTAMAEDESTWSNATTPEQVRQRIEEGRVYQSRQPAADGS